MNSLLVGSQFWFNCGSFGNRSGDDQVLSGGQESYPLRIFTLGRSGRWTAAGRSSAGRPAGRPGGARVVSGAEKKNHLIEAAPFGRLDQMLRASV